VFDSVPAGFVTTGCCQQHLQVFKSFIRLIANARDGWMSPVLARSYNAVDIK